MKWKTSISGKKNGKVEIRGKELEKLVEDFSFSDAAYLTISGKTPNKNESALWNAILISSIEHGVEAPSAYVARTVASTTHNISSAMASGILAIGEHHGGAGEAAARLMQSSKSAKEIVAELVKKGERMPGYGHKIYKDADPRAEQLLKIADKLGLANKYVKLAQEIKQELKEQTGKDLPLNIDGAHAALLSELGFNWRLVRGVFAFSRTPGIVAHSFEEITKEKPYRRLDESDIEYSREDQE